MQIRKTLKTQPPQNDFEKSLQLELFTSWRDLATLLNGGLMFSDNFNCATVNVSDTGVVNTEFTVAHALKRIPIGYLVIRRNKAGTVYDSGTAFDTGNIYLKCSVANVNLTVIIF